MIFSRSRLAWLHVVKIIDTDSRIQREQARSRLTTPQGRINRRGPPDVGTAVRRRGRQ